MVAGIGRADGGGFGLEEGEEHDGSAGDLSGGDAVWWRGGVGGVDGVGEL